MSLIHRPPRLHPSDPAYKVTDTVLLRPDSESAIYSRYIIEAIHKGPQGNYVLQSLDLLPWTFKLLSAAEYRCRVLNDSPDPFLKEYHFTPKEVVITYSLTQVFGQEESH